MNVYKVTLMVIDHDEIGAVEIAEALENARYANRCIHPVVTSTESRDIGEWSDEHPLNSITGQMPEFNRLFSGGPIAFAASQDCKVSAVTRVEQGEAEIADPAGFFGRLNESGTYVVITGEKIQPGKWKFIAEREVT